MNRWRVMLLALALAAPVVARVASFPNEPEGFGKVKFGEPVSRLQALYPGIKHIDESKMEEAYKFVKASFYELDDYRLSGLPAPVHVVFRFLGDRLWSIHMDAGENEPTAVRNLLVDRYGPPNVPAGRMWMGERVYIGAPPGWRSFEISSRALAGEANRILVAHGNHEHETTGESVPPGKAAPPPAKASGAESGAPSRPGS